MIRTQTVGFMLGVFDLFHIGHVRILCNSKALCDRLIVGVIDDETVLSYKGRRPVISLADRMEIVRSVRYVDSVVCESTHVADLITQDKYGFDVVFCGDDWINDPVYCQAKKDLEGIGVQVVYFPYTKGVSSTQIRSRLNNPAADYS